jgi:transcriptional regulator with XRE-family HTH domain
MESIDYYVRQLLRKHRRAKRLSLRQAGRFCGICFTTVNTMESGKYRISLDNLVKLAELYQVPPSYLLREAERLAYQEAGWKPNDAPQWQEIAAALPGASPVHNQMVPANAEGSRVRQEAAQGF